MKTFQSLSIGSQFASGTNHEVRREVMKPIIATNQDCLNINIEGIDLTLKANWSISRKSVTYYTNLTKEQYVKLTGGEFGLKKDLIKNPPALSISMLGEVTIYGGGSFFIKVEKNTNIAIL